MYLYLKALHIIFVVTWFAGLFYMPRFFIYNTEAGDKPEPEKTIIRNQLYTMMKRLWYIITWPSAIITLVLGLTVMVMGGWDRLLTDPAGKWLLIKLCFVLLLFAYHWSLHRLFKQEERGEFRYSSGQLRGWNEVSTLLLFAIVFVATVKQTMSWLYGTLGLVGLGILLMMAIKWYKRKRERAGEPTSNANTK